MTIFSRFEKKEDEFWMPSNIRITMSERRRKMHAKKNAKKNKRAIKDAVQRGWGNSEQLPFIAFSGEELISREWNFINKTEELIDDLIGELLDEGYGDEVASLSGSMKSVSLMDTPTNDSRRESFSPTGQKFDIWGARCGSPAWSIGSSDLTGDYFSGTMSGAPSMNSINEIDGEYDPDDRFLVNSPVRYGLCFEEPEPRRTCSRFLKFFQEQALEAAR